MPRWVPNALTLLRVALIPAFLMHAWWCTQDVAAGAGDQPQRALAAAALVGIGVSDVVDGWIARRFGLATPLGATLDAVADKLAQVCLLAFFFLSDGEAFAAVPGPFIALILGRDAVLALGSLWIRRKHGRVDVEHQLHGRVASVLLFALMGWITLDLPRVVLGPAWVVIAILVLLSTVGYVRHGWRQWVAAE